MHSQENRDTVEEFWHAGTLEVCIENARKGTATENFAARFSEYVGNGSASCHLFSSGRRALTALLASAIRGPRKRVLVSEFNCPVIPAAVNAAGLQTVTYDMANCTGRFDWNAIGASIPDSCCAIVIPHFFGVPTDFRPLISEARKKGVLLIEDCAHTLGGLIGRSTAGSIGDAAIFSFAYDKPISLGAGGALVVNTPGIIPEGLPEEAPMSLTEETAALQAFLRFLDMRRRKIRWTRLWSTGMFRLLARAKVPPFLPPRFEGSIGNLRAALGLWQLEAYDRVLKVRNRNGESLRKRVGLAGWHVDETCQPAWLKQKVFCKSTEAAKHVSDRLQRQGFRVGMFNWPISVSEIDHPGFQSDTHGQAVAHSSVDVPVHQNITLEDTELIADELAAHIYQRENEVSRLCT
jgi:dTDP-4-amino-4,6-dideoxygalactose transaminase